MAVETIGYAVLSGVARWQKIDPSRMRVMAVTSITSKRVYVRKPFGSETSSRDIEEVVVIRDTHLEAEQYLKLILDRTRDQREDLNAKRIAYESAADLLEKQLRASFEPRPEPRKSTAQKLGKLSTEDLEAELQRRKGGQ